MQYSATLHVHVHVHAWGCVCKCKHMDVLTFICTHVINYSLDCNQETYEINVLYDIVAMQRERTRDRNEGER